MIVDAIAQGNPEAAEKAVKTHMENAERTLLKAIEEKSIEEEAATDKRPGSYRKATK